MKKTSLLIIVMFFLAFTFCSCAFVESEYYIFDNIEECEQMEHNLLSEAKIHKFNALEKDSVAQQLQVDSSYAATYSFEKWDFEIVAYEFKNSDDTKKYFYEYTRKQSVDDINYSAVKGMKNYRLIVIDNENAYQITTRAMYVAELNDLIATSFSLKISFSEEGITTQEV